jgi:hypothetical protein
MATTYAMASSLPDDRFIVEDPKHNYLSARFPPDSWRLAERAVEVVRAVQSKPEAPV